MFKNVRRHKAFWFEDSIEPAIGSVVFCKLIGNAEHTGIFIGHLGDSNKCIIELDGNGLIKAVTPEEFLNGQTNTRFSGIAIYTSCDELGQPLGSYKAADLAKKMVNARRDYHLVVDNCHQFTCGCLSGDFENSNNFFWMVEEEAKVEAEDLATDKHYREIETIENDSNLSFDKKYNIKTELRKKRNAEVLSNYNEQRKKMWNY